MPMDYDPMLSKLIAYAPTRAMAIERMLRALNEYAIGGIRTNLGLFRRILTDPAFRSAAIDTHYLDRLLAEPAPEQAENDTQPAIIAAALAAFLQGSLGTSAGGQSAPETAAPQSASPSAWKTTARREALRS